MAMRECSGAAQRGVAVCAAATGFAGMTALAIAGLSTTEACAARTSGLLCRGLLSYEATVAMHDRDARVQQCRSADRMLCAQRCHQSAAAVSLARILKHNQGFCRRTGR